MNWNIMEEIFRFKQKKTTISSLILIKVQRLTCESGRLSLDGKWLEITLT